MTKQERIDAARAEHHNALVDAEIEYERAELAAYDEQQRALAVANAKWEKALDALEADDEEGET